MADSPNVSLSSQADAPAATNSSVTDHTPETGRGMARNRIIIGASVRQVAEAMGVAPTTLARWERDISPLDEERGRKWLDALIEVMVDKLMQLERAGWTAEELVGADLGTTLQTFTAPRAGQPAPDEAAPAEAGKKGQGQ